MSRTDLYPSRVGGSTQVRERLDPVVQASSERRRKGPLSAKQLADYETRGFERIDDLLSAAEIDRLRTAVQQLFARRRDDASSKVVREPGGDDLRSIFEVHEDEEAVYELVRHPRVLSLANQILGAPAYVHQSRVNYKPAFTGRPFYWHSDFETWHVEDGMPRMCAFSISINLAENRVENGPLMVIPESHHRFVSCAGYTPQAHYERSLRRQEAGIPPESIIEAMVSDHGLECATGPVGSSTLFDCNLMHGSNGNITPFPRTNLFLVFNRVDNALAPPYSGQPPRPQHVANRSPRPLP